MFTKIFPILVFCSLFFQFSFAEAQTPPYQNGDGYTVFTPSVDTQIIYVSDSEGSDSNDGLSTSTPVQTIVHGKTLLRPGFPDWLLLKKGDTWEEALGSLSDATAVVGRSADEPALISSYGTGARPVLEFNGISGFIVLGTDTPANYVAIVGIEFYNAEKDPESPTYDSETDKADVSILSDVDWFLVEDNVFRFLEAVFFPYTEGDVANLSLRKNIFRDVYSTNSFASCLFTAGTLNLLVEDNIFDNCGWAEGVSGAEASGFNRAAYLCCGDGQTVYRGNIDYNGSSGGVQLRTGGTIEDSLFLLSPIAITIGSSQNSTTSTVPGLIRNNVMLDSRDIDTEQRGFGIWLTSSEVGEENGGGPSYLENVQVYNNIISSNVSGTGNVVGITVGGDGAILGLDIYDNVIYDWREPDLANNFASALNFNNTSTSSVDIVINDNYFQQPRGGYLSVVNNYDPSRITFSGNTYWSDSAEGSQYADAWFELNGGNMNYTDWVSNTGEVGSTRELTEFVDPDRSIATYMTSLGIGGGLDEFMNRVRQQSRDTYDERFTSYAVNEYVRAGFVLAGAEPTPDPVITFGVSSSSITEGSTTTLTWSTTDATSCTASNGWTGARATAGSLEVSPADTTTYTLTCVGDGGSDVESVVVTVTAVPDPEAAPVVTFGVSSSSITAGNSTTLTWSTTDATSCTASNGWSGARATAGSLEVTPADTTTYTLTCVGDGGSDVESVVVTVTAVPDPDPEPEPEVDNPPSSGGGGGGGGGGSRSGRDSGPTFKLNQQVTLLSSQVVKDLSEREDLGTAAAGSTGKIISKLVRIRNSVSYMEVAFTNGLTGWVDRKSFSTNQLGTPTFTSSPVTIAPTSGQVRAVTALNIRVTPNGRIIGTEEIGAIGTIESAIKPEVRDGYTWVYVQFGSVGGFVAQDFLAAVVPPSAERDALLIAQIQLLIAEVQRLMLLLAAMKGI